MAICALFSRTTYAKYLPFKWYIEAICWFFLLLLRPGRPYFFVYLLFSICIFPLFKRLFYLHNGKNSNKQWRMIFYHGKNGNPQFNPNKRFWAENILTDLSWTAANRKKHKNRKKIMKIRRCVCLMQWNQSILADGNANMYGFIYIKSHFALNHLWNFSRNIDRWKLIVRHGVEKRKRDGRLYRKWTLKGLNIE